MSTKHKLIYVNDQWYIIENKIPKEGDYYMVYSLGILGNFAGWGEPELHENKPTDKIHSRLNPDTVGVLVATNNPAYLPYNNVIYRINKIPEKLFAYNDTDRIYSQEDIAKYIEEYICEELSSNNERKIHLSPEKWLEQKQFKSELYHTDIVLKFDVNNNAIITTIEGLKCVTIKSFALPCLYKEYNNENNY